MPRKIFKKLNENMIVSTDSVEMMEQYIASEYPDLSRDESQKVLIQYIQQRLEEHLTQFDEKYLPYIKFRLIRTALGQRPYQISAGDVLKACVHLNFGIDAFYQDLNSWIMDHAGPGVTEAEIRGFVLKLRQWARWNSDKPLEEMFREETISEPEVPKQPVQEENLWRESQTGRLVPVDYNHYFDENEWKPVADDTAKPIKSSIVIRNIAIASVSLLILVGGSLWMASSYNYEKARVLKAALSVETADETITKTETSKSSESQKTEPVVIAANDYTTQTRAGRNEIVNRSRLAKAPLENLAKEKPLPVTAKRIAEPAPQVNKMVVVGAEEGTKTPIIREYGSKLTMSAKGFMREKRDNIPDTDAQNSTGNGPVTKNRVVTANPRVIPPGSRVYINFPSEYQNMDGVYTVESNNGLQSHQVDVFFGEEAEGDDNVSKRIDAFGSNGVDVYILK